MARKKVTAADCARITIKVGGLVLTLIYGYLEFTWDEFHPITRSLPATALLHLGLLLYFVAWFYGTSWDVEEQEAAFSPESVRRLLARGTYAAAAMMVAVYGGVCWLSAKPAAWFLAGLLVFWIANTLAWHFFLRSEIRHRIDLTKAALTGQHAKLKILDLVEEHMLGTWQAVRFAIGAALLLGMNVIAWSGWGARFGARLALQTDVLFSLSIVAFVVLAEVPIWFSRVRTRSKRELLEDLEEVYSLVPVAATAPAAGTVAAVSDGVRRNG